MLPDIFAGLFITIVGGLVLYVFGVGKNTGGVKNSIKKSPTNVTGNNNVVNSIVISSVKDQKFQRAEKIATPPDTTEPTAIDILNDVRSRPLFQQKKTGSFYEGLHIVWSLKLADVRQDDEIFHISAVYTQEKPKEVAVINFEVKAQQYPELKFMMQYDEFWVRGEIQSVSSGSVMLKNCIIMFSNNSRQ